MHSKINKGVLRTPFFMSHNHDYEPMPSWVIWVGIILMIFTVLCFVLMTLGMLYW
jgi:hypothetical protein